MACSSSYLTGSSCRGKGARGAKAERSKQTRKAGEAERAKREPTASSTPTRQDGGGGASEGQSEAKRTLTEDMSTATLVHTQRNHSQPKRVQTSQSLEGERQSEKRPHARAEALLASARKRANARGDLMREWSCSSHSLLWFGRGRRVRHFSRSLLFAAPRAWRRL